MSSDSTTAPRVALVTGASRGIGAACARRLAQSGCAVAVHYASNREAAEAVVTAIAAEGGRAAAFAADLAAPGSAAPLVEAVAEQLDPPGVLVHAAGAIVEKPVMFTTPDEWAAQLQLHALAAHGLSQSMLRHLRKLDHGRLIFLGSLAGQVGLGNGAAYAAAKGALHGLARSLALECARWGVTANVVAPGYVDTDMTAGHDEKRRAELTAAVPLGRYGTTEEVAALVAYLASPEAGYLTGQVLTLDGGLSLG